MSREAKFGGVTVRVNDDGTLFIYQPDSSRVMGPELAEQLTAFLIENVRPDTGERIPLDEVEAELLFAPAGVILANAQVQSTVPAGVINTSDGAVTPEVAEALQQDGQDHGPVPEPPAPRRRGRPPKAKP